MCRLRVEQALRAATAEVLESMFFTSLAAELPSPPADTRRVAVSVRFDGELRGSLALAISGGVAGTLAVDFLGLDGEEGPAEDQVEEVMREMANMICGKALSALERSPLRLSPPAIVRGPELVTPHAACTLSFALGDGWLTVAMGLEARDA